MPVYIVTLKDNAPESELKAAKSNATKKGGKIVDEFALVKGFSVEYPEDHVDVLESNEHVHVEKDTGVKTQ